MYYYARLICKASVYKRKLVSELFLATSCLLYADTVPLKNWEWSGYEAIDCVQSVLIAYMHTIGPACSEAVLNPTYK